MYHEKLAKSVMGKCFRHLAGPHICDTIDVLTSRSVTYRKFSRHRWKKLRKKKDVTVSDVICQINRTKNRRKSNPKWRILYRKRIQSFKFFKKDLLVFSEGLSAETIFLKRPFIVENMNSLRWQNTSSYLLCCSLASVYCEKQRQ